MDSDLSCIITALQRLKDSALSIHKGHWLGIVHGIALDIVKSVDEFKGKECTIRLAISVEELAMQIHETGVSMEGGIDDILQNELVAFMVISTNVKAYIGSQLKKDAVTKFLCRSAVAKKLDKYATKIDAAKRTFNMAMLMNFEQSQAQQVSLPDHDLLKHQEDERLADDGKHHSYDAGDSPHTEPIQNHSHNILALPSNTQVDWSPLTVEAVVPLFLGFSSALVVFLVCLLVLPNGRYPPISSLA